MFKIFKKRKNDKKIKEGVNDEKLTVTNQIEVKIYRDIGGGNLGLSSRFMAIERKDDFNNLFAISRDKNFKEDLDFHQDRIYDWLFTNNKLINKKRPDQIKELESMVKTQSILVNDIKDDVEKNVEYNLPDEEEKLKQIKIILEYKKKIADSGTYMTQEGGGIRTFYFKLVDGLLFPYWWGKNSMRVDPDLTVAKKTFIQENNIFNAENSDKVRNLINWSSIIIFAIGLAFCIANVYFAYSHNEEIYSMAKDVNQGTITCTNTLAVCAQKYEQLSSSCNLGTNSKNENNINEEKPSINNLIKTIN